METVGESRDRIAALEHRRALGRIRSRRWVQRHPEWRREVVRRYCLLHREEIRLRERQRYFERYHSDPEFRQKCLDKRRRMVKKHGKLEYHKYAIAKMMEDV